MRQIAMSIGLAAALTAGACGGDDDDGGVGPDAASDGGDADAGDSDQADGSPGGPGWQALDDLPSGAIQETAVVALDGRIYVLGGIDGSLATRADVRVFDPASGGWDDAPPLPLPVHHVNAAVFDGRIHVVGSLLAGFDPIGDVWSWAPGDQEWSVGASMPPGTERGAAAIGVVGGRIVVAGGLDGSSRDAVSAYDPVADEWDVELPALPARIDHGTGQVVGDVLHVIGGRTDGTDGNSGAVWALVGGAWEERAAMPTARGGIAAGVLDGKIAVVGGEGNGDEPSGVFAEAELYDPATDEWTALPDMRTPRHGMGAAAVDDALYVPGGATREAFGAVATFDVLRLP